MRAIAPHMHGRRQVVEPGKDYYASYLRGPVQHSPPAWGLTLVRTMLP